MINQDSLIATSNQKFGAQFIRPDYGGFCFAHLPNLIQNRLGVEKVMRLEGL